jgi:hypothetical protein
VTWNHTICEYCWFKDPATRDRFPTQLRREEGDLEVDRCCFCGSLKITRIYVRESPGSVRLRCAGTHGDDDD